MNRQEPSVLTRPVWYSDWDYREDGKVHARLTFNPSFDWQASVMADVLASRSAHAAASKETAADLHPSFWEHRP